MMISSSSFSSSHVVVVVLYVTVVAHVTMHKGAHVRILDALGEENGDTPVDCKDYCKVTMVASGQDTESDVDKAWDTRENAASEHSNSAGENSDASSTNESNNERSLALSSNEVEEHDLFSMAAEEGQTLRRQRIR